MASKQALVSLLCKAIVDRDETEARNLIAAGADPNANQPDGAAGGGTPMHRAADIGSPRMLELLHAAGGDVNVRPYGGFGRRYANGATPLTVAAEFGTLGAGRWLLEHGADEMLVDENEDTALCIAMKRHKYLFAEMLMNARPGLKEAQLNKSASRSCTLSNHGRASIEFQDFMLTLGVDPNLVSDDGDPWLVFGQKRDNNREGDVLPILRELIRRGADVNSVSSSGMTPLTQAVQQKIPDIFIALLQAGADPDFRPKTGASAREMLQKKRWTSFKEMREVFKGWEACHRARQIIDEAPSYPNLSSL